MIENTFWIILVLSIIQLIFGGFCRIPNIGILIITVGQLSGTTNYIVGFFKNVDLGINQTSFTQQIPAQQTTDLYQGITQYKPIIDNALKENGIKQDIKLFTYLAFAHIECESRFNEQATSEKGAQGLMQLMPKTYQEIQYHLGLGVDAYNPKNNIRAGIYYMVKQQRTFNPLLKINGSMKMKQGISAYHAGPNNVHKAIYSGQNLPYNEKSYNRKYVWCVNNAFKAQNIQDFQCNNRECLRTKGNIDQVGSEKVIYDLAIRLQNELPIIYFTAFNDGITHKKYGVKNYHNRGLAMDFPIFNGKHLNEKIQRKIEWIGKDMGLNIKLRNFYKEESKFAPHFHLEVH